MSETKQFSRKKIPFDHPFSLNLACRSIRGWPRILFEAWATDNNGRNYLAGYGTATVPFSSGHHTITVDCWRPSKNGFAESLLNNNPEFIDSRAALSNEDKIALQTVSTGTIQVELDVLLKDFHLHGII